MFRIVFNLSVVFHSKCRGKKMEKLTEQRLTALLAEAGIEPVAGGLERFSKIIDGYVATLKLLQSANLGDEEIAPVFHAESFAK